MVSLVVFSTTSVWGYDGVKAARHSPAQTISPAGRPLRFAQRATRIDLGDFTANMTRAGGPAGARLAALFLQTAPAEFLVAGVGDAQIAFSTDKPGPPIVGILSIDEEFFDNGAWLPRRRLNGDEDSQGQSLRLYASDLAQGKIYRVRLYRYR